MKFSAIALAIMFLVGCSTASTAVMADKALGVPEWDESLSKDSGWAIGDVTTPSFICFDLKMVIGIATLSIENMRNAKKTAYKAMEEGECTNLTLVGPIPFTLVRRIYMYTDIEDDLMELWELVYKGENNEATAYTLFISKEKPSNSLGKDV
jgi:hypothetical protein